MALSETFEDVVVLLAGHGVGIDAGESGLGELADEFLFGSLSSAAEKDKSFAAGWASSGDSGFAKAIVAKGAGGGDGAGGAAVIGKGDVAVLAGEDVLAGWAGDEAGVSATIQKEDGLLALIEGLAEFGFEGAAKEVQALAVAVLLAKVDELDGR